MQSPVTSNFLLAEPAFELLGGVGRSIIEDEGHRVDAPSQCLRNDLLLHEGLEIDEAFALAAGAVDLARSSGKSGKQVPCATTLIARFVKPRLTSVCWTRRLLALSCLDGGFLIQTDQPRACLQEGSRLPIGLEHGTSPC